MEKILCAAGAGQRPVILIAPLISSHYENPDRLFLGEAILRVLKKIVVPGENDVTGFDVGGGPEIYLANLAARAGMPADHDKKMLPASCLIASAMCFHADVIVQRSPQKNVVPGGDSKRRDVYIGIVFRNRPAFPIVVISRVREPVEKVRSQRRSQIGFR